jgi:anti-sigma regulatory factor (Ser/Thr protein kinase)
MTRRRPSGRTPADRTPWRLVVPASVDGVRAALEASERQAVAFGASVAVRRDLGLVLDELLTNVAGYAFAPGEVGTIELVMTKRARGLDLVIRHGGLAFDPLARPAPDTDLPLDERPVGGLGIYLVRQLAQAVAYQRDGEENVLRVRLGRGPAHSRRRPPGRVPPLQEPTDP